MSRSASAPKISPQIQSAGGEAPPTTRSRVPVSEKAPKRVDRSLGRAQRIAETECLSSLGDDELVALVLAEGHEGVPAVLAARDLLEQAGGLTGLAERRAFGLRLSKLLVPRDAARLAAALELGKRVQQDQTRIRPEHAIDVDAVSRWAKTRLVGLCHEEVWVLCVDARTTLKSTFQVGRGGMHGCALLTRDIVTPVVRDGASAFVLVHNHPSGDPTPSREDIEMTRALALAATTLCVPLLDHVVVARGGTESFFALGLL